MFVSLNLTDDFIRHPRCQFARRPKIIPSSAIRTGVTRDSVNRSGA